MKRLFIIVTVLLSLMLVSYNYFTDSEKLKGKWVSDKDSNWTLYFYNNYYLDSYLENHDTVLYEITEKCTINDNSESNNKRNLFFINTYNINSGDSICFEVLGLTDTTLSLMETSKGYLFLFKKSD